jgi:hypothetical protein
MKLTQVIGRVQALPPAAWVGAGALAVFWFTRPRPSSAVDGGTPLGSEDIQISSAAGAYNPVGAHAPGLPYSMGHCCPVSWKGRTKAYPTQSSGVIAMMAAPDPADDDGYPWLSFGPQRGM